MNFAKRLGLLVGMAGVCATVACAQAPVFTSPLTYTGYVGVALSYSITTDVAATYSVVTSSLPAGLTFSTNVISGKPQSVGTNVVAITATNSNDDQLTSTTNLTLIVFSATPSPSITNVDNIVSYVGSNFSYQIDAKNVTVTGYDAMNLPAGLSVNRGNGMITGRFSQAGISIITLVASNATSVPGTNTLTLTILEPNQIFMEGFEGGVWSNAWQAGDARASGSPAYWAPVPSTFAGISAEDGNWMAYCAGDGYGGSSVNPTYQNYMAAFLQRSVNLSGCSAATLSFWSRIAGLETAYARDSCRVRVSTDNGQTWTDLWTVSRVDADWTPESVSLDDYAGRAFVLLRFEFNSDATITSVGWFLDQISLSTAPGDKFDNATEISLGTNHTFSVATQDVSRVTLRQGYQYVITAIGGTMHDPQMWLYSDSDHTQFMEYNDDASGLGHNSRITFECPESGDYFIQVGEYYGNSGTYTLLVVEQPARADIVATDVDLQLPEGDPRNKNPIALVFSVANNGPVSLNDGGPYPYFAQVYLSLSTNSTAPRIRIGGGIIELDLEVEDYTTKSDDNLTAYVIPDDLPADTYYVWLSFTPLGGSPTDTNLANNLVVGNNTVELLPPDFVKIRGVCTAGSSGISDVTVTRLSDDGETTNVVTDAYGNYLVVVSNGWRGTITPSNSVAGLFWPATRTYATPVSNNLVSQNFAFGSALGISGRITTKSVSNTSLTNGVTVTFAGYGATTTVTTDANGYYSNIVVLGWTGTVSPSTNGLGGAFSPTSKSYRGLTSGKTRQNFTWTPPPIVSGRVMIKGTKIAATNMVLVFSGLGVTTNDANGNYAMTVPYNWSGTITPSTNGHGGIFSPVSKACRKLTSNKTISFTWKAPAVPAPPQAVMASSGAYQEYCVVRRAVVVPVQYAVVAPVVTTVAGVAPQQLLHTVGRVRWTGEDAIRARQATELLTVALVDGVVTVTPTVPVVASGELSTTLDFVDGLSSRAGTPNCNLLVVRNDRGLAKAEPTLTDTIGMGELLFLSPGRETILTWDLLLLQP